MRHVLLERDDSQRWEIQEALLILTHDGSAGTVEVLETYLPRAPPLTWRALPGARWTRAAISPRSRKTPRRSGCYYSG